MVAEEKYDQVASFFGSLIFKNCAVLEVFVVADVSIPLQGSVCVGHVHYVGLDPKLCSSRVLLPKNRPFAL